MARSLLFGTSVSPGIAIGVLRFAHNVQTVEMRRISPREVEGEQEQLRAAVTNVRAALQGKTPPSKKPSPTAESVVPSVRRTVSSALEGSLPSATCSSMFSNRPM